MPKKSNEKKLSKVNENILVKVFGTFKFKKSSQQMKDEVRKELYND